MKQHIKDLKIAYIGGRQSCLGLGIYDRFVQRNKYKVERYAYMTLTERRLMIMK